MQVLKTIFHLYRDLVIKNFQRLARIQMKLYKIIKFQEEFSVDLQAQKKLKLIYHKKLIQMNLNQLQTQ